MPLVHPGGECKGHLEVLDIVDGDLGQLAVTSTGIVLGRHCPLAIIRRCGCGWRPRQRRLAAGGYSKQQYTWNRSNSEPRKPRLR